LKIGSVAAAGVATTAAQAAARPDHEALTRTTLPYPTRVVARAKALRVDVPVDFAYPDADSPCLLVKIGRAVTGGVGPDGDVVAYSKLCAHMGCPVQFVPQRQVLKCPCHFSQYDAERKGQMICGQATMSLARIVLAYDEARDELRAVGVDGLIYGRQANLL